MGNLRDQRRGYHSTILFVPVVERFSLENEPFLLYRTGIRVHPPYKYCIRDILGLIFKMGIGICISIGHRFML